jgi:hypothetical protein
VTSLTLIDVYRFVRRNSERLGTLASLAAVVYWRAPITQRFSSGAWNVEAFYSAVFDWSSIQAAFLFGVYAFFLSRSEPFIQAISESAVFGELRGYVRSTLYLTLLLSVVSLPLLVLPPKMESGEYLNAGFIAFAGLGTALVYTFLCFLKVIRVFGKIESVRGPGR